MISGWNPAFGTAAQVGAAVAGAVYKGLAIADTAAGPRLYATDFHDNRVDVWDDMFAPAAKPGAFTDRKLPNGFAPFGIQAVGNRSSSPMPSRTPRPTTTSRAPASGSSTSTTRAAIS